VILATRNAHKLREFERLLPGLAFAPLPGGLQSPEETGETYAENALIKARAAARATGQPAFADDSGIEAEALGGRPGVRSARFAGEHATDEENLAKLLREAPAGSKVAYVCALAYVDPHTPVEHLVEGRCIGTLAAEPRGTEGFGYDPVVVPEGEERTVAELGDDWKSRNSHRARAAQALRQAGGDLVRLGPPALG